MVDFFDKRIARLRKRVAQGKISCLPGCFVCCKTHLWTWTEWEPVEDKRYAENATDPCPYASDKGCAVYEQRPIICRVHGLQWDVGVYMGHRVRMACQEGLVMDAMIPADDALEIFKEFMAIIRTEAKDRKEAGEKDLFAGPYGKFVKQRYGV